MIKSNHGITLISLMAAVLIMVILIGTGITAVYTNIKEVKDNKWASELGIVRQSIAEQYTAASAVGQTKMLYTQPGSSYWIGERIESNSEIEFPDENVVDINDSNYIQFCTRIQNYNPIYQEDFYYRLNTEQLTLLGLKISVNRSEITDSDDKEEDDSDGVSNLNSPRTTSTYIVNYSTGEVYNETKKINSEGKLLYLPSMDYSLQSTEETEDEASFNDWN